MRSTLVPLAEALGRASAETVRALHPEPRVDVAAMDGFALRIPPRSGGFEFRLRRGLARPGRPRPQLRIGQAIEIATGAALPRGANAVLRRERARTQGRWLFARRRAALAADVHRAGEDVRRGDVLLRPGERVRPYHLPQLLDQGITRLRVRVPRVTIVATGDEIRRRPVPGGPHIRDSISPLIAQLAREAEVVRMRRLGDDPRRLVAALREAAASSDLIVTIGGTSIGRHDRTKAAVASVGRVLFAGVRVNVLKRGAVGEIEGIPIVMLPGQVVAAVIVWHEYGRTILARLAGSAPARPEAARLAARLRNPHAMDSLFLFRYDRGRVWPRRWGVRLFSELARADAYGVVPRRSDLAPGTQVEVRHLVGAR